MNSRIPVKYGLHRNTVGGNYGQSPVPPANLWKSELVHNPSSGADL